MTTALSDYLASPGADETALVSGLRGLLTARGAKVIMTADDTTVNATSGYTLSWDSAEIDTDSFWSAGAPTRLTIGSGINYVSVDAQVSVLLSTAATHSRFIIRHFNSSDTEVERWANEYIDKASAGVTIQARSGLVAVSQGDYFEAFYVEESDNSITIDAENFGGLHTTMSLIVLG